MNFMQMAAIVIPILYFIQFLIDLRYYVVFRQHGWMVISSLVQTAIVIIYFVMYYMGKTSMLLTGLTIGLSFSDTITGTTLWLSGKSPAYYNLIVNIFVFVFAVVNFII